MGVRAVWMRSVPFKSNTRSLHVSVGVGRYVGGGEAFFVSGRAVAFLAAKVTIHTINVITEPSSVFYWRGEAGMMTLGSITCQFKLEPIRQHSHQPLIDIDILSQHTGSSLRVSQA